MGLWEVPVSSSDMDKKKKGGKKNFYLSKNIWYLLLLLVECVQFGSIWMLENLFLALCYELWSIRMIILCLFFYFIAC